MLTFKYKVPTGSRVICNPPPMDTDEDFIILIEEKDISRTEILLKEAGFSLDGTYHDSKSNFKSYKKGTINYIITHKEDFFHRFVSATQIAKDKNLIKKEDRVDLFKKILYG